MQSLEPWRSLSGLIGKEDEGSIISINFNKKKYVGQVTCTWPKNRANKVYRMWFGDDLKNELKEVFLMTFMRDIESRLRPDTDSDIERDIPFWEFLDIEFDEKSKTVRMTAHYTQTPTFPELFRRLTYSPTLKRIDDELADKTPFGSTNRTGVHVTILRSRSERRTSFTC